VVEGEKVVEVDGVKVQLKEYSRSVLVIKHNGDRDEVKQLLEREIQKPVLFLGELLLITG